mmetsp:Transcript_17124/g.25315  ORF Transcript_17124/g.25315 Transcript_17124/m.25315 type:complete len:228 (+) Transcript_17124:1797-2480(+)
MCSLFVLPRPLPRPLPPRPLPRPRPLPPPRPRLLYRRFPFSATAPNVSVFRLRSCTPRNRLSFPFCLSSASHDIESKKSSFSYDFGSSSSLSSSFSKFARFDSKSKSSSGVGKEFEPTTPLAFLFNKLAPVPTWCCGFLRGRCCFREEFLDFPPSLFLSFSIPDFSEFWDLGISDDAVGCLGPSSLLLADFLSDPSTSVDPVFDAGDAACTCSWTCRSLISDPRKTR